MSIDYWQYQIPLWMLFLLFLGLLWGPLEIGFQLGMRRRRSTRGDGKVEQDLTVTALFTLLALMLAFTYAFCMGRADLRKQAIVDEVNALETFFLRADRLDEPGRSDVRQKIYNYTVSRYVPAGSTLTLAEFKQVVNQSLECQSKLWPAVNLALRQPNAMSHPEQALLISSVNDVLDLHTSRLAVIYDRLPLAVLTLLLVIAGTSLGMAAYNSSQQGPPIRWRMRTFAFILASLIYLILDYDMMMRGLIQVDHSSLELLIVQMEKELTR